ncbi:hypothetical protein GCM10007938_07940 [Vibrio zhanjiangensis]|uniref:Uncharacterized protein n=1 Tax=Vibrio zhanjiangensis TaxID=1046128 RepID=A0ABQ6EV04_9VIBR|nr:hypothetical protein [Vibrio zhanjiangensis]GLT17017.1 hypothetical protein GCM10007938_07940 [Vibrio zhanjiangensis]
MKKQNLLLSLAALYSTSSLAIIDITPSHIEVQGEQCESGYRLLKPAEARKWSSVLYDQNKIDMWGRYFLDNGKTLAITQDNSINTVHDAFEYLTNIEDNDPNIPTGQSLCTKQIGNFYAIDTSSETKYQKIIYNELAIDRELSDGVLHTTTTDQVSDTKYGDNLISRIRVLIKVNADNSTSFMIRAIGENATPDSQVSIDRDGYYGYVGLTGTINGNFLHMRYNGTGDRALGPTPPLLDSYLFTPGSGNPLMKYWEFKLNLEESIEEGYVLATLNIFSDKAQKQLIEKTNISFELNNAEYFPETGVTLVGNSLLSSPIHFRTDEYSQNQWSSYHLLYSTSSEAIQDQYFSGQHIGAVSPLTQEHRYAKDVDNLILAQQTTLPLELPTAHRRQKRCVEDFIQAVQSLGAWALARWWGEPSVCGVQNNQPIANVPPLIVDEPQSTGNDNNVVYEVIETQPHSDNPDAFNTAMNVFACDDNVNTDANEGTCTTEQNDAINLIGDLTRDQLSTVINEVHEHLNLAAQGAGPALSVNTGNPNLDSYINHHPDVAIELLNSAMQIADASNVKPDKLVSRRSKKGKKRNDNVVTGSCANSSPEVREDDGFQCVQKIRRRANRQPTDSVVSLPPLMQTGGQYFTRSSDSANFRTMIRAFNNIGVSSRMNRNEVATNTWAIAYDGAAPGNNRRFVVLSDANNGRRDRFGFGLAHIWTNRDGGHQNDFTSVGINNREMLAHMIMAALTSTDGNVRISTRTGEGGQRRDYAEVRFVYGGNHYVLTNVAIVVGSDGYVITAFPVKKSTLRRLKDEF